VPELKASVGNSSKSTERAPSLFSLDMNLSKDSIHGIQVRDAFRADFYNFCRIIRASHRRHAIFSTASTFGAITGTSVGFANIEAALKVFF